MTSDPLREAELEALFAPARDELRTEWRERLSRRLLAEAEQGDAAAQEIVSAYRLSS